MGSDSVSIVALALVTAAFLLFVAIELGGLTLPGWHTVSYLAHNHPPLRWALVGAVLAFGVWLAIHTAQPIAK